MTGAFVLSMTSFQLSAMSPVLWVARAPPQPGFDAQLVQQRSCCGERRLRPRG
jgi:hypothetical protein